MDYKILRANKSVLLEAAVKQAMADGYMPQGGIATGNLEVYQAMVKTSGALSGALSASSADPSAPQGGRRRTRTRRYRS
jgi:hypothetical protein